MIRPKKKKRQHYIYKILFFKKQKYLLKKYIYMYIVKLKDEFHHVLSKTRRKWQNVNNSQYITSQQIIKHRKL